MPAMTIQQTVDLAKQRHQAGRLQEAEQLYRQILAQQPDHAEATHLLGVIAHQSGRQEVAAQWVERAICLRPDCAEAYSNLGTIFRSQGKRIEAIAAYRRAIALRPDFAEFHHNLGIVLAMDGHADEAMSAYRQAIILKPGFAKAHSDLGISLAGAGRRDEAIAAYRQAIALDPTLAEAYANLGNVLRDDGQMDEAVSACRQAIALRPNFAEGHGNLGSALRDQGQTDEAIIELQTALSLNPGYADAWYNLALAMDDLRGRDEGQLDKAIAAYQRAIALQPAFAGAFNNLAAALKDAGRLDEAIAAVRQAIALKADNPAAHSNLIYMMHMHPDIDLREIAVEQRLWNQRHAEGLLRFAAPTATSTAVAAPHRRLRIGYVSPDFRDHVVGRNIFPLLARHDHERFEIFCYAHLPRPDAMTARFQRFADAWRDITRLSDDNAAQHVRDDRVDILVDLALHTAHNRLGVFARKPAPIQATFAGYPGSTGLNAIDYRLSDPYLDPPGTDESIYSEQTIRLPHSFWCYDPLENRDVAVNPLPTLQTGAVTFACLNNFCKINQRVLDLWANVLRQVENSRLLLLAPIGNHRRRTTDYLAGYGIGPDRVHFVSHQPRRAYLETYHGIDLGLDTFPYNGHTTSLDALWMGVPVITLVGQAPVSRGGWCQLSNLGLEQLAAGADEQFVQIAVELARDLPRLAELRATLRGRMERSPLMDGPNFARSVEAAYVQMRRRDRRGVTDRN